MYKNMFLRLTVMLATFTVVYSLSCPLTCDQSLCTTNTSMCQYGTTLDICFCCMECAKGPGEVCGGIWGSQGTCTNGTTCLVTVPFGSSYNKYTHASGYCKPDASVIQPTTSITYCSSTPTPSLTPTPTPTPVKNKKDSCRTECNYEFCSDGKNKYCSANKTASRFVSERAPCQHTTCRACRILVYPDCPRCPIPVKKRCLRHYFLCIDEHYKRSDILLAFHDSKAGGSKGQVICHVPDLPIEESGSGEGN